MKLLPCFFAVALLTGAVSAAQTAASSPPARYQVILRYQIVAARDQHVVQYDAMIAHLEKLGFAFDPPLVRHAETDREDRSKNYLKGSVAPDKLLRMLSNPSVASLLVMPQDFKYPPEDLDKIVRVRLE